MENKESEEKKKYGLNVGEEYLTLDFGGVRGILYFNEKHKESSKYPVAKGNIKLVLNGLNVIVPMVLWKNKKKETKEETKEESIL